MLECATGFNVASKTATARLQEFHATIRQVRVPTAIARRAAAAGVTAVFVPLTLGFEHLEAILALRQESEPRWARRVNLAQELLPPIMPHAMRLGVRTR